MLVPGPVPDASEPQPASRFPSEQADADILEDIEHQPVLRAPLRHDSQDLREEHREE